MDYYCYCYCCCYFVQTKEKPYAGQWSAASLGDDKRNDKFLRLLGGFKSGNKDSAKTFASKALDAKKQEKLYKGLENQYDQAFQTSKVNRGKGLGFSELF